MDVEILKRMRHALPMPSARADHAGWEELQKRIDTATMSSRPELVKAASIPNGLLNAAAEYAEYQCFVKVDVLEPLYIRMQRLNPDYFTNNARAHHVAALRSKPWRQMSTSESRGYIETLIRDTIAVRLELDTAVTELQRLRDLEALARQAARAARAATPPTPSSDGPEYGRPQRKTKRKRNRPNVTSAPVPRSPPRTRGMGVPVCYWANVDDELDSEDEDEDEDEDADRNLDEEDSDPSSDSSLTSFESVEE